MADNTPIENKADAAPTSEERQRALAKSGYRVPGAWFREGFNAPPKGAPGTEATAVAQADGDALPDDFPARALLVAGGFDTLAKVREATDEQLVALDNVGEATLAKIRAAQG